MTIGQMPVRDRLIFPRRQGVPLAHVFTGETAFPTDTTAFMYLYDAADDELAFWPLAITGAAATLDVDGEEWWPYRNDARSFTVFIIYPSEPAKRWSWYEGNVVRPS